MFSIRILMCTLASVRWDDQSASIAKTLFRPPADNLKARLSTMQANVVLANFNNQRSRDAWRANRSEYRLHMCVYVYIIHDATHPDTVNLIHRSLFQTNVMPRGSRVAIPLGVLVNWTNDRKNTKNKTFRCKRAITVGTLFKIKKKKRKEKERKLPQWN